MMYDATPSLRNHHLEGQRLQPSDERRLRRSWTIALLGALLLVLVVGSGSPAQAASADDGFVEEEVLFESGGATLHGTVLAPNEASPGRRPAVALVHGSGPGPRELNRREAEAFAREGIVALIYDKRTEGYSASGLGERSYELLAGDALAAVRELRGRPEVDPEAVGLWGLSEGGWVAPLAANRSDGVAFVVLIGASGVPPVRQMSWYLENELRHRGVSGSVVEAVSRTGIRVQAGTDGMAEAYHDPVAPLEWLSQPVLAIWGEKDRVVPPAESARIVEAALRRGGNRSHTLRFFPDAQHGLEHSPNGFTRSEKLVEGYPETVAMWITRVANGEAPPPSAEVLPRQPRSSGPVAPLAWWESSWVQLGAMVAPALAFTSHLAVELGSTLTRIARRGRYESPDPVVLRVRRRARRLASVGMATLLGFVGYFGFLVFTAASVAEPVVVGRTVPWLALQASAVATCAFTVLLAASWWSAPKMLTIVERLRPGVLLAGGVVFAVWAAYWGLLSP